MLAVRLMKRRIIELAAVLLLLITGGMSVYAEEVGYDAAIGFSGEYSPEGRVIEGTVSVYVAGELMNDKVQMSWHIEDASGNMLVFENERFPLKDMQLPAEIPVRIDLGALPGDIPPEEAVIAFDIVDEENIYWYSLNPDRKCDLVRVTPADVTAAAAVPPRVVIDHGLPDIVNDSEITVNARVTFNDPSLYNEGVKISYKLYSPDMEPLATENERYPLEFNGQTGRAVLDLKLSDVREASGYDEMIIIFDLVDEKNVYWFKDSDLVDLKQETVRYKFDRGYEVKKQYQYIFSHQYIQLIINIIGTVFTVVLLTGLRKRLKDGSKEGSE